MQFVTSLRQIVSACAFFIIIINIYFWWGMFILFFSYPWNKFISQFERIDQFDIVGCATRRQWLRGCLIIQLVVNCCVLRWNLCQIFFLVSSALAQMIVSTNTLIKWSTASLFLLYTGKLKQDIHKIAIMAYFDLIFPLKFTTNLRKQFIQPARKLLENLRFLKQILKPES